MKHQNMLSIAISTMLLLSFLFTAMTAGAGLAGNPQANAEYWTGQTITDAQHWSDTVIVMTGNLIISGTGSLTLTNVTFMMNCSVDGQYMIEVQAGGALFLNDTDGDSSTPDDASFVTNGLTPGRGYLFLVQPGAVFHARNSRIENCGLLAGGVGAENSGLTLLSSDSVLDGMSVSGCANGVIIDSCDATITNSTITGNKFHGIYVVGAAIPSHRFDVSIANSTISSNAGSGILAVADYIGIELLGNTLSNNMINGTMLDGGIYVNATVAGNTVSSNKGLASIGAVGSTAAVLNLDIRNNTVSESFGTGLKFGVRALKGKMLKEVPVHTVNLNLSGNTVTHSGNSGNGIMFVYATESIQANVSDNRFLSSKMEYGISIGCLNTDFNERPATRNVTLDFMRNDLTTGSKGALRVTSNDTLDINMVNNTIYGTGSMDCGCVFLGWFQDDMDMRTAHNSTMNVIGNAISTVSGGGGIWMDSLENLVANVENNTFSGTVSGGAIRLGGIMKTNYPQMGGQICHNTIGAGSLAGIHAVSPTSLLIFSNTISGRTYAGDGIRVDSSSLLAHAYNNTVRNCGAGGIRLMGSRGVQVHNNILDNNMYGIIVDSGASKNILKDNIITKPDSKYGFYVATNSLDHAFPTSNLVNGQPFMYFRGMSGAPGALLPTGNMNSQNPPLMSNLGQVVYADCSYLYISNVTAGNGTNGLVLINVDDSVITGNVAVNNRASPGHGISLQLSSDRNVIMGNALSDNLYGIGLPSGVKNTLWSNTVQNTVPTCGGFYITPSPAFFDNEITTNNTVNGDPVHYLWADSSGAVIANHSLTAPLITNLGQIVAVSTANLSIQKMTVSNGIRGLYLLSSTNVSVEGSAFLDNTDNILASEVSNLSIASTNVSGGQNSIRLIATTGSITDSNLMNASISNFNMSSSSSIRAINTTFDRTRTVMSGSTEQLEVCWYLGLTVSSGGIPLSGARAVLSNLTGHAVLDTLSDVNGTVPTDVYVEYRQQGDAVSYHTPHCLAVSKDSFSPSTRSLSLDENQYILVSLSDVTPPNFASGPAMAPMEIYTSNESIWISGTLDDSLTGNSTIAMAEWSVSVGGNTFSPAVPLQAEDGAFDQVIENLTATIDISLWKAGDYVIRVRGMDSAGNWCPWHNITFYLTDNQGPILTLTNQPPSPRIGLSASTIRLNMSIDDSGLGDCTVADIEWRILNQTTGSNGTITNAVTVLDGAFNEVQEDAAIRLNLRGMAEGEYVLFARGWDSAGNAGKWLAWDFELYDDIVPVPPMGLWAINTTEQGELKLIWTANHEDDLAGYNIYRSITPGADYEFLASVGPDVITWTDTGLKDGTAYYYVLTAFDNARIPNESPFSAESSARTPDAPVQEPEIVDIGLSNWYVAIVISFLSLAVVVVIIVKLKKRGPPGGSADVPSQIESFE